MRRANFSLVVFLHATRLQTNVAYAMGFAINPFLVIELPVRIWSHLDNNGFSAVADNILIIGAVENVKISVDWKWWV